VLKIWVDQHGLRSAPANWTQPPGARPFDADPLAPVARPAGVRRRMRSGSGNWRDRQPMLEICKAGAQLADKRVVTPARRAPPIHEVAAGVGRSSSKTADTPDLPHPRQGLGEQGHRARACRPRANRPGPLTSKWSPPRPISRTAAPRLDRDQFLGRLQPSIQFSERSSGTRAKWRMLRVRRSAPRERARAAMRRSGSARRRPSRSRAVLIAP
jgi:hypothetical protein